MNGSTTSVGGVVKSGERQHRSKSPAVMSLAFHKNLVHRLRPSSISSAAVARAFFLNRRRVGGRRQRRRFHPRRLLTARLLALFSICFSAACTSVSSGWRCRMVSYSRMAEESWPNCT